MKEPCGSVAMCKLMPGKSPVVLATVTSLLPLEVETLVKSTTSMMFGISGVT
jgi:hypothetical protein